jgi:hypothetical protein
MKPRRNCAELVVRMPDVTLRLLSAAAERRGISAQELALRILIGTVHKGSIHKAANFYLDVRHPGKQRYQKKRVVIALLELEGLARPDRLMRR